MCLTMDSNIVNCLDGEKLLYPYLIHLSRKRAPSSPSFVNYPPRTLSSSAFRGKDYIYTFYLFFFLNSFFFSLFTLSFLQNWTDSSFRLNQRMTAKKCKKIDGRVGSTSFSPRSFSQIPFVNAMTQRSRLWKRGSHTPTEWSKEFGCNGKSSRLSLFVP